MCAFLSCYRQCSWDVQLFQFNPLYTRVYLFILCVMKKDELGTHTHTHIKHTSSIKGKKTPSGKNITGILKEAVPQSAH